MNYKTHEHGKSNITWFRGHAGSDISKSENLSLTIVLAFLFCLVLQKCIIFASQDFQMDFFQLYDLSRMFLDGASPYYNTPDNYNKLLFEGVQTGFRYPPTVLVLFSWLSLMKYGLAKLVWMLFNILAMLAQIFLVRKYLGDFASIVLATLILGFPVDFALQRGSTDLLLAFCITYFIIFYLRGERKWSSAVALAFAVSLKLAPALFVLIYLKQKDYRGLLRIVSLVVLISVLFFVLASIFSPDVLPDFIKTTLSYNEAKNTFNLPNIKDGIVDNWLIYDGWSWRFSMNYFGSYASISLIRFVNYLFLHCFGFKLNVILFTLATLFGVCLLSVKSTTKTYMIRLLLLYPVLNPIAWGATIAIMFIGLIYVFNDIYQILIRLKGEIGIKSLWKLLLFAFLVFMVLSPRYVPYEYEGYSTGMMCVYICVLSFFAGMFETEVKESNCQ